MYLCSSRQFELLSSCCGGRIVDRGVDADVLALLNHPGLKSVCNLVAMSPSHVAGLLPTVVPAEWRVQREVSAADTVSFVWLRITGHAQNTF